MEPQDPPDGDEDENGSDEDGNGDDEEGEPGPTYPDPFEPGPRLQGPSGGWDLVGLPEPSLPADRVALVRIGGRVEESDRTWSATALPVLNRGRAYLVAPAHLLSAAASARLMGIGNGEVYEDLDAPLSLNRWHASAAFDLTAIEIDRSAIANWAGTTWDIDLQSYVVPSVSKSQFPQVGRLLIVRMPAPLPGTVVRVAGTAEAAFVGGKHGQAFLVAADSLVLEEDVRGSALFIELGHSTTFAGMATGYARVGGGLAVTAVSATAIVDHIERLSRH
ncbi:MAG: hypothetical protein AAF567_24260 [Actinomycetota bacterium]